MLGERLGKAGGFSLTNRFQGDKESKLFYFFMKRVDIQIKLNLVVQALKAYFRFEGLEEDAKN